MLKITAIKTIIIVLLVLMVSYGLASAHGAKHKTTDIGNGVSYARDIFPVWNNNCASCHGAKSPEHAVFMKKSNEYISNMIGPRMDNYTLLSSFVVWPETGALMRNLDDGSSTPDGKPGKMYVHLGGSKQERKANLELFKKWVGYWTLKNWETINKDEIDLIKIAP